MNPRRPGVLLASERGDPAVAAGGSQVGLHVALRRHAGDARRVAQATLAAVRDARRRVTVVNQGGLALPNDAVTRGRRGRPVVAARPATAWGD
jgi:hypothetical protein